MIIIIMIINKTHPKCPSQALSICPAVKLAAVANFSPLLFGTLDTHKVMHRS